MRNVVPTDYITAAPVDLLHKEFKKKTEPPRSIDLRFPHFPPRASVAAFRGRASIRSLGSVRASASNPARAAVGVIWWLSFLVRVTVVQPS